MKKENYLPFDLETALAHPERVVTRDGGKVSQFIRFESKSEFPLLGVVDNEIFSWDIEGEFHGRGEHENDLFLLPEVKECWVNVYEMGKALILGETYISKSQAIENASSAISLGHTYIKTIRITNEPE